MEEERIKRMEDAIARVLRVAIRHHRRLFGHFVRDINDLFHTIDRNHDGKVTRQELASAAKQATGSVPPDSFIDRILAEMDDDGNGSISEKEFAAHFKMTSFMLHRRSLESFCSTAGNKPPKASKFRQVGAVDINARSWECGNGTGMFPCVKITDTARLASVEALKTGFTRAFLCAIAAGALSQMRIFYRLEEFREVLLEISKSDRLTSNDVAFVRNSTTSLSPPLNPFPPLPRPLNKKGMSL